MMGDVMDYLLKTEPSTYSYADLQREKTTTWDGVSNPVALKNLRAMKPGERLVIYHTGDEKTRGGDGFRSVGGCIGREESASDDQGRPGQFESGDAGRGEGERIVCGISAGAAGKTECGAFDGSAV